jgi:hypothetical protein
MAVAAQTDPYAGVGTPVGAPPPASGSDPYANVGTPVGATPAQSATPSATPPQDDSLWGKVKSVASGISEGTGDPNIDLPVGFAKSAAAGVGGLLHLVHQYVGNGAGPSDVMEYKQANPAASDADAMQAVKGGYRGPTTQGANAHMAAAADWLQKHGQENGIWQNLGGVGEMAGELLSGLGVEDAPAEGARVLSSADKLAQQVRAAKFLEGNPKIAKLAAIGARTIYGATKAAAETGAQTYVHTGGNADAATTAAELGAGGGALMEAGGEAVSAFRSRTAPAVENIAGEPVQTLSSQRPGTGPRGDVKVNEVPKVGAAQQAAAPRVFQNLAQRATHDGLEEANQGRRVANQITDPARMLAAPEDAQPYPFTIEGTGADFETSRSGSTPRTKQIGSEFAPGKGSGTAAKTEPYNEGAFKYGDEEPLPPVSDQEPFQGPTHKEPILQYLTDLKPGEEIGSTKVTGGGDLVAAGPEAAQTHLSRLNDLVDNPPEGATPEQMKSITQARDGLQEQMDMYHGYQNTLPNFNPIDSARAAEGVSHFGDAADQLQNAAKPIYQKFDQATDGQFNDLNRARVAAGKRGDFTAKHEYEAQIDQLIDKTPGISQSDRLQATKLWNKSKVLDGLNDMINHAANVDDKYASQVSGGRVLSGVRMQNGMQQLIKRYGTDRLESVIGKDGMENMTRISDLLNVPKAQTGLKGLSMSVLHTIAHGKVGGLAGAALGHHLAGYEGALVGATAGVKAERWMLQMAATSPRVGKLLDYAVRNNVTPKVAAGLISSAMIQENQPQQEEKKEDQQ